MRKYSQRDPKWSREYLGDSRYTVGRWGCLMTAIAMIHSRFYRKNPMTPLEGAKNFKYTEDGLLRWDSDFPGMEFVRRGYGTPSNHLVKEYTGRERGIAVQVDHTHWAPVYFFGWWGIYIIDPFFGDVVRLYKRYDRITGFALFEKSE